MVWHYVILAIATASVVFSLVVLLRIPYLRWVRAPIRLRRTMAMRFRPDWRATGPEDLSPEIQEFVGGVVRRFREAGFETAANVVEEGANGPGSRSLQVLLVNRATGDVGSVVTVTMNHSQNRTNTQYRNLAMAVMSRFGDGKEVATASSRAGGVFPKNPLGDWVNATWIRDARVLCEFHRRRMAERGFESRERVTPVAGGEMEYLLKERDDEMQRIVRAGYGYRDEKAECCRATWKGAILMVWKSIDPVRSWRINRSEKAAREEWTRLGMDSWAAPPYDAATAMLADGVAIPTTESSAAEEVRYETVLREGEVRTEERPGTAVVHVGTMSVQKFLRKRLLLIFWLALADGYVLYRLVSILQWQAKFPRMIAAQMRKPWLLEVYVVAMTLVIIWQAVLVAVRVRKMSGTTMLTASRSGLVYRNLRDIRGRVKTGEIAREDVAGMSLVRVRKRTVLVMSIHGAKPRVLAIGNTEEDIKRARQAMLTAMGMHAEVDERLEAAVAIRKELERANGQTRS